MSDETITVPHGISCVMKAGLNSRLGIGEQESKGGQNPSLTCSLSEKKNLSTFFKFKGKFTKKFNEGRTAFV